MAKRISSVFSLSSDHSDQSSDSRLGSSVHPARPPKEQTPAPYARKSTSDLRPTNNLQELHSNHNSGLTPPFNATLLPRIEDDDPLLQRSQYPTPFPPQLDSPGGSRRTNGLGMPTAYGTDDPLVPPPSFLKPVPMVPDSPSENRPVGRGSGPESPAGSSPLSQPSSRPASSNTLRPLTPTTEQKLSKKRSWLRGKTNTGLRNAENGSSMPQSWVVTPQEKLPYDATALANFHRVGIYPLGFQTCKMG